MATKKASTKTSKSVTFETEKAIFTVFGEDGTTKVVEAANAVEAVRKAEAKEE
jgi:hypothetical protein